MAPRRVTYSSIFSLIRRPPRVGVRLGENHRGAGEAVEGREQLLEWQARIARSDRDGMVGHEQKRAAERQVELARELVALEQRVPAASVRESEIAVA